MNPHHALMQELATARQADLLRAAKADRDAAGAATSRAKPALVRLAGPAASFVFALRARRRQVTDSYLSLPRGA